MNKKRIYFYGGLVLLIVAFLAAYFLIWQPWLAQKMVAVEFGLADYRFPWKQFSQEELDARNLDKVLAKVKTTVTPEETYEKFREALKNNDLELALAQLSKNTPRYEENKETLERAYKEGRFLEAYNWYPQKIEKSSMYDAIAQYTFSAPIKGEKLSHIINFQKNSQGVWLIESI